MVNAQVDYLVSWQSRLNRSEKLHTGSNPVLTTKKIKVMKKISVVGEFNKSKTGIYNFVLLDGTRLYEFERWSNNEKTLNKEREKIIKINPELGNRLIIVKTEIRDFYYS